MRQKVKHILVPRDEALFERMKGHYTSKKEIEFFERMRDKEEWVLTVSNDLILYELDNPDHIYIVRCEFEEYIIGHSTEGHYDEECHAMCLADALNVNLKELGFISDDITLLPWLRNRDYAGVQYDHNYDDL